MARQQNSNYEHNLSFSIIVFFALPVSHAQYITVGSCDRRRIHAALSHYAHSLHAYPYIGGYYST